MTTDNLTFSLADLGLFTGKRQYDAFSRLNELAKVSTLQPSSKPFTFPRGEQITLPETYDVEGESRSSQKLFDETDTGALFVLHDGKVVLEKYALTGGPDVAWLSMSVAKSFTSTLVGIAQAEGHIKDLDAPISDYVKVDSGSAYDGVSIRTVLRMSSGARWNEDYSNPESDIMRFARAASGVDGGSLDGFVASMVRESPPDTVCRYNSAETQVLGALVKAATGRSVTDYMQEKLCEPLGFQHKGYWILDPKDVEHTYGGLNLAACDFAKIGELFRNGGKWGERQIVPEQWVREATTVDGPLRAPGKPIVGGHALPLGYGYQWWVPAGDEGEFCGIGVYNQFVYVNPARGVTVVKSSANPRYGLSETEEDNKDMENLQFIREIAAQFAKK
ncbi:6-aminohexanoate-dimer hydrolase [Vanrija pseudolonga]|uniref:6-aminohexanoate-dimer hydrolase n=1 Tax=Vanrija pseudolonga TaxID=143232 RepID=A0AAF1BIS8_9TREE|nr:6-aminohexanoate-dimer hydrolase [Vanrija pseudolonga]